MNHTGITHFLEPPTIKRTAQPSTLRGYAEILTVHVLALLASLKGMGFPALSAGRVRCLP